VKVFIKSGLVNLAIVAFCQSCLLAQEIPSTKQTQPFGSTPPSPTTKAVPGQGEERSPATSGMTEIPKTESVPQVVLTAPLFPADSTSILRDKIDQLQGAVDKLAKKFGESSAWTTKDIAGLLSGLAAIGALFLSYRAVSISRSTTLTQLRHNVKTERAKALQAKLDTFYGPLVQLRNTSNLLYDAFRARQPDPENFRTLTAILSGASFEGNDKVLLDEIIKIGEETENLILKSSGLVDEDIQPLLGKATTHYRILRLAHKGMLKGEPEKYREHVYPRDLDSTIDKKIRQIRNEIAVLTSVDADSPRSRA
jgi:hypothetical protein